MIVGPGIPIFEGLRVDLFPVLNVLLCSFVAKKVRRVPGSLEQVWHCWFGMTAWYLTMSRS